MSWFDQNKSLNFIERTGVNVIKCGHVPNHVAIIMDGNRRYATQNNMITSEGHKEGFARLADSLFWCRELGIREVTVYAFSYENFKRDKSEVDTLLDLAREKFEKLLSEQDKLDEYGVRIRIIGKISCLPDDLRELMCRAMYVTRHNNQRFLNVAFAYISTEEITTSIQTVVDGVNDGSLNVDDVDEQLLNDCLYTNECTTPDVLIRTSGETRFSNFLLWQMSFCLVIFTKILWPDFSLWHLLWSIFLYQRKQPRLDRDRLIAISENDSNSKPDSSQTDFKTLNQRQMKFIDNVKKKRSDYVELAACKN